MKFCDIWTITKKEMRSCINDKIILLTILILPFVLVTGFSFLTSMVAENSDKVTEETDFVAYSVNTPEYMRDAFSEFGITDIKDSEVEKKKESIADKECNLLILFPEDFSIGTMENASELSNINIWYNSSDNKSLNLYSCVNAYFSALQPKAFTVNESADETYDLVTERDVFGETVGQMVPLLLIMAVFMGCMNLSAEIIAGDKERGFLNTILISPISRYSIVAGKALSIYIISIISAISAFIGLIFSLPQISRTMDLATTETYSISEYIVLFILTILVAFTLTIMLLIVSVLAKSLKQATTITPSIVMVLSIASIMTSTAAFQEMVDSLGIWNALIPVWNIMLGLKYIVTFDWNALFIVISCCVDVVFCVLAIIFVGKCFKSERIINN